MLLLFKLYNLAGIAVLRTLLTKQQVGSMFHRRKELDYSVTILCCILREICFYQPFIDPYSVFSRLEVQCIYNQPALYIQGIIYALYNCDLVDMVGWRYYTNCVVVRDVPSR